MARRVLQASSEGIKQATKATTFKGWTQQALGEAVGLTRQPVGKFFSGKPVQQDAFIAICAALDLDWKEIADLPAEPQPDEEEQDNSFNIDVLVQEVRQKVRPIIQERCGTMRVLDMSQPIGLNDIYTDVNILEKITGRRRVEISELLQGFNPESEDFDRFGLSRVTEKRVPGLEAVEHYSRLMVLGKPGAGKTTFLKYLAIQCISGELQADRVPIFITLKDFAETSAQPGLLEFIIQMFASSEVTDTQIAELLKQGRALLFFDGLDEVRDEDSQRVLREIRYFSEQYYTSNFIITCRIAAQEYRFEKFTDVELADVEVADFDDKQIQTFVIKWFQAKQLNLADRFMQRLNSNPPIRELATSPLLLTLLCLVFENSGNFPTNRAELYSEGIAILLRKWDATRGIERDQVYKKLSVQRKEDLLSKVALTTFERGDYFFKQRDVERYIADYIRNLPDTQTGPEALQLDSEVVLKSIEAQHGLLVERARGIYSFSHLTFQEYFTARKIVTSSNPYSLDDKVLQKIVSHISEKRWREVFLLAVGMLPSADYLLRLMKQQIDSLVANDEKLQQLLMWINQKSISTGTQYYKEYKVPKALDLANPEPLVVNVSYKLATVRAFYLELARPFRYAPVRDLDFALAYILNDTLNIGYGLDFEIAYDFNFDYEILNVSDRSAPFYGNMLLESLTFTINQALDLELKQELQQLKDKLPDLSKGKESEQWWKKRGNAWTKQLREVMIKYRNIAHDWRFSHKQEKLLKQYYDANLLLVECLSSDCYVSREVRSHIEDTLLLPIAEIEKRRLAD
jgi:predicted NACHT family NTPase